MNSLSRNPGSAPEIKKLNKYLVLSYKRRLRACAVIRSYAVFHVFQAGVFVSRSSVQLVQIRRVEVLSILQGINMLLWVIDVHVSTELI